MERLVKSKVECSIYTDLHFSVDCAFFMIYLHFFGLICVYYYLASIPLSFITLTFHDANLHVAPDNIVSVVIDRGLIGQ